MLFFIRPPLDELAQILWENAPKDCEDAEKYL